MTEKYRFDLLDDTKTCYHYLQAGLGMILLMFVAVLTVVIVPAFDETASAVEVLVLPSLFVGLGLLLFGVGTHLHVMHLNVVLMSEDNE